ncbi:MAG: hypothetical protein GEU73_06185 [Chloroflexi bacterium]|nr:hypothetical protein [Chloroflexota bacterium]
MCGRIARERRDLARQLGFEEISDTALPVRFNIAPTVVDVFVRRSEAGAHLEASHWGLIPVWAKDRSVGSRMFNARAETLLERSSFRTLVRSRRCIVPVSGFYEWRQSAGRGKEPLYIHRADGQPMVLAGLWTMWHDPNNDYELHSHTVVTCAPNAFMAEIHNRMPVVLPDAEAWEQWLDPRTTDPAEVLPLAGPCDDDVLEACPVSTLVNNTRNDGPELIAPALS